MVCLLAAFHASNKNSSNSAATPHYTNSSAVTTDNNFSSRQATRTAATAPQHQHHTNSSAVTTTSAAASDQQQHNALTTLSLLLPFNRLSDFGSLASGSKAYAAGVSMERSVGELINRKHTTTNLLNRDKLQSTPTASMKSALDE
jgi:hypothetical protein